MFNCNFFNLILALMLMFSHSTRAEVNIKNDGENLARSSQSLGKLTNQLPNNNVLRTSNMQLTRTAIQQKTKNKATQPAIMINSQAIAAQPFYDFAFYDVVTTLAIDADEDGYYQSFSVVFDADIVSASAHITAQVYAQLYISEDGGPWLHLYTSDNFTLVGESSDDSFTIDTRLYEGYYANEYDLLIDLYEVGYSDVVATISSEEINSLYALPLESEDYDHYRDHDDHGGASKFIVYLLMFMTLMRLTNLSLLSWFIKIFLGESTSLFGTCIGT